MRRFSVALLVVGFLSSCATVNPFGNVHRGMSKSEVKMNLGDPNDVAIIGEKEHWIYRVIAGMPPLPHVSTITFKGNKLESIVPGDQFARNDYRADDHRVVVEFEHEGRKRRPKRCVDRNAFGEFAKGGGCNTFGCWRPGGSCNAFGCSAHGECEASGCPAPVDSYQCRAE